MRMLGLESSCDETACAIVHAVSEQSLMTESSIISSQVDIHNSFGGVVPEVASRQHIRRIIPVIEQALAQAGRTMEEIDGLAVTQGPGLVGALLVAVQTAKAVAYSLGIP